VPAQRRLAHLAGAGDQYHLALKIGSDKVVKVAFHAD
jgi:hypothetical protein